LDAQLKLRFVEADVVKSGLTWLLPPNLCCLADTTSIGKAFFIGLPADQAVVRFHQFDDTASRNLLHAGDDFTRWNAALGEIIRNDV
jgi:hypothetical protein